MSLVYTAPKKMGGLALLKCNMEELRLSARLLVLLEWALQRDMLSVNACYMYHWIWVLPERTTTAVCRQIPTQTTRAIESRHMKQRASVHRRKIVCWMASIPSIGPMSTMYSCYNSIASIELHHRIRWNQHHWCVPRSVDPESGECSL